jgi:hypothetical protein
MDDLLKAILFFSFAFIIEGFALTLWIVGALHATSARVADELKGSVLHELKAIHRQLDDIEKAIDRSSD